MSWCDFQLHQFNPAIVSLVLGPLAETERKQQKNGREENAATEKQINRSDNCLIFTASDGRGRQTRTRQRAVYF